MNRIGMVLFAFFFAMTSFSPGQFRDRDGASNRYLPPGGAGAQMGVRITNRDYGVEIVQVIPGSPANQAGFEPGDVIITVGGYQVGFVNGRLYDLAEECNRRIEPSGEVRLVLRKARSGFLANQNVLLTTPFNPGPILPPNPGWGQGLISGTVTVNAPIQLPPGAAIQVRLLEEGIGGSPVTPVADTTLPNVPGFPVNYQLGFRQGNLSPNRRYYVDARLLAGPQVLGQTNQPYWYNGGNRPQINMVIVPSAAPANDQSPIGLITQWYRIYLGREPDPAGLQGQILALQQGQSLGDIQVGLLSSSEFFDRCNNNAQAWIGQLYALAINQKPKPSDIDYWTGRIRYHKGNRAVVAREFLKAAGGG